MQLVSRSAMRESVREGLFHPAVQQRGCAVPEQWVLQHDDVGTKQAILFRLHVDAEIRIELVQIDELGFRQQIPCLFQYRFVGKRIIQVGVARHD